MKLERNMKTVKKQKRSLKSKLSLKSLDDYIASVECEFEVKLGELRNDFEENYEMIDRIQNKTLERVYDLEDAPKPTFWSLFFGF